MKLSELPEEIRVKLTEEGTDEFWHRVDEFGGVKQLSDSFGYSASKMYNWRSKDSFLPVELVRKVFGNEAADEIAAIKGRGRSKAIRNPEIPLPVSDELLTRVDLSVTVNSDGTPVYQANDRGNAERFVDLLEMIGDVPYSVYVRDVHEVRYPKFLHRLFEEVNFEEDIAARIDEEGEVREGMIVLPDRELSIDEFDGDLYHRDKRLRLALARNDRQEIAELMGEEARKTREMF